MGADPPVRPLFPAAAFDVIGLAASRGGLATQSAVLSPLPATFPAARQQALLGRSDHPGRPLGQIFYWLYGRGEY